mmetsp:Transcript_34298/g.79296  ORF Transcript_34298/g.79296 Transcript_34298/m.79296 type:complete len:309 (-) Transcript_34298:1399-2325(-)
MDFFLIAFCLSSTSRRAPNTASPALTSPSISPSFLPVQVMSTCPAERVVFSPGLTPLTIRPLFPTPPLPPLPRSCLPCQRMLILSISGTLGVTTRVFPLFPPFSSAAILCSIQSQRLRMCPTIHPSRISWVTVASRGFFCCRARVFSASNQRRAMDRETSRSQERTSLMSQAEMVFFSTRLAEVRASSIFVVFRWAGRFGVAEAVAVEALCISLRQLARPMRTFSVSSSSSSISPARTLRICFPSRLNSSKASQRHAATTPLNCWSSSRSSRNPEKSSRALCTTASCKDRASPTCPILLKASLFCRSL